jgi:hypothetical protein
MRHKNLYRLKAANTAVRCGNAVEEALALEVIRRGQDLSLQKAPPPKPVIESTIFSAHFEKLFSKDSDSELLGLTEAKVGPKVAPKPELSGAPSLAEVKCAITKLSRGTAPGSNGLRPELFKAGGDMLAERITHDLAEIWPTQEEIDASAPSPPRARVFQTWQDADVVTLYKQKGDPTDPGNYRGIFLLDVAGKVLTSVIDKRLKVLIEESVSDSQHGFRKGRSTSHLIHVMRRTQEACKEAGVKAYAVFVDFAKAFDSPPRSALWECLDWAGCPPDLLAVIMAIHADPRGKLRNTSEFFKVTRGVRQGCVLGPTLFIILLEYCLRCTGTDGIGIQMQCVAKKGLALPPDLLGMTFMACRAEYADDLWALGDCPVRLSIWLSKLQEVCGSIGLDISVGKTEWLYLSNPNSCETDACGVARKVGPCCEQIKLGDEVIRHTPQFTYLGSVISESGGVRTETETRVGKAFAALNRHSKIFSSQLRISYKMKYLQSYVLPSLTYGTECANHVQVDLKRMDAFLNASRARILCSPYWRDGWRRTRTDLLKRRCALPSAMGLISPRRLAFLANLVSSPKLGLARAMLFAEVVPALGATKTGSNSRSSYLAVVSLDVRYLAGPAYVESRPVEHFLKLMAATRGKATVKRVLKALCPRGRMMHQRGDASRTRCQLAL